MRKSQISNLKPQTSKNQGLVITYFGDGKGKTTAALGLALRASGYKEKVLIIQFVKGDWASGEEEAIKNLKTVKLVKSGAGFVGILGDKKTLEIHSKAAQKGINLALKSLPKYKILILDEILGAIKGGLVSPLVVLKIIKQKPKDSILVMTGRPKIDAILNKSDLITEMRCIKHPFDKGTLTIKGIDY